MANENHFKRAVLFQQNAVFQGALPTIYRQWDAANNEYRNFGPVRITGNNALSNRYELKWTAGQRGLVTVTASVLFSTDHDFEILGTNAVAGSVTANPEGGLVFTTAGADGDSVILLPWLSANKSPWTTNTWGSDQQTEWECDIKTGANITNAIVYAGLKLTNTDVIATDNDQVYFRYQDSVSSGAWVAVSSIGNVDTSTVSTVTAAINTRYHLKVTIDSSRIARMYINGALIYTTAALTDATDFIPYIGVKASGAAAAKVLRLVGQSISRVVA